MVTILLAAAATSTLLVGVLEQPQCREGHRRSVRVLFERSPAGWKSLGQASSTPPSFPSTWTVAFDGRSLGRIATVDPGWKSEYQWTYPRDRLLDLIGEAPSVRTGSDHFGGWCGPPSLRPLVVASKPKVTDPAGWKRVRQARDMRGLVFAEFGEHARDPVVCPVDSEKAVPFHYTLHDVVQLACYGDLAGRRLVAVSLDAALNDCDGPPGPAWWPNWFVVPAAGGRPAFLGDRLWLVDAGDYDRDGDSELVFWFSGYNRDGYVLFTGDLTSRVDYLWNYH